MVGVHTLGIPALCAAARRVRAATLVIACTASVIGYAGGARAEESWPAIRSRHFTVTGEAPERELRAAAEDLEAFRSAVTSLYPGLQVRAGAPTWVVIFKERQRFERFLPRDSAGRPIRNVGGYYLPDPDVNYIVFGRYNAERDRRVILHEYAHAIFHRSVGALPLWLTEGLADFYSTFDRNAALATGVIGRPPADLLAVLRSQDFISLDRLVTPTDRDRLLKDGDRARMFYAESWALVHYLMIGSPHAAPGRFATYVTALNRAVPPEDAFRQAFGESIDEADGKLRNYVRRETYNGVAVERGTGVDARVAIEPLPAAVVSRIRGDLLLRVGTLGEAEEELTRSLSLDPAGVDARVAMARLKTWTGRAAEGLAELDRIAAQQPHHFGAQYYLGGALASRRSYREAFAAFDTAVLLRDDSASAWFAFSTMALALGMQETADASLNKAMQLEFNPASYRSRAYAAFSLGRLQTAATDATRYVDAVGMSDPTAQNVAFIGAIAYARTQQPGAAQVLLDQVRSAAPRGSWNADIVEFLQGRLDADGLLLRAKNQAQKTTAHTYIGLKSAQEGREADALFHLRWVRNEGAQHELDYKLAIEELVRMEMPQPDLR